MNYAKQSLILTKKLKNSHNKALANFGKKGIVSSYCNIGLIYQYQGNYNKALKYFQKSLILITGDSKETEYNKKNAANIYHNIANVYLYQGNYVMAIKYYQKALKIDDELSNKYPDKVENKERMSNSFSNIGVVHYYQGNYDDAIKYYKKSIKIDEELANSPDEALAKSCKKGIAASYNNIGLVHQDLGNYDDAIKYYKKSLKIKEEFLIGPEQFQDKRGIGISYNNIGIVYMKQGNYAGAIKYYKKALKIDQELGNKNGMAGTLINIGLLNSDINKLQEALNYCIKGLTTAKEIGAFELEKNAYGVLSKIFEKMNDYSKALEYYKLYSEAKDSLFNEESHKQITEMMTKYETEKKEKEIALLNKEKKLQNVELARKDAEVKKKNIQRNAFIGGFALVLVLALVVYRGYRQKKRANIMLDEKNVLITRQKAELTQTLEELRSTQEQLVESEKMASLGNLVAGVAHEINTPVGIGITASSSLVEDTKQFAELYKKDKMSRKALEEYLENTFQASELILKNMNRTGELVQNFKQVSVDQMVDEKRKFNLKSYVNDIILSIKPEFGKKKIKIDIDCDKNLELNSIPGAFAQIITNLTLNSIRHGFREKEKGGIRITAHTHDLTPSPSPEGEGSKSPSSQEGDLEGGHLGEDLGGAALIIQYSDNGSGISEENLPKIFDPFFTTNKQIGTGLGLNIVYNLVTQKLKGTVSCESIEGQGVLFTINVPI